MSDVNGHIAIIQNFLSTSSFVYICWLRYDLYIMTIQKKKCEYALIFCDSKKTKMSFVEIKLTRKFTCNRNCFFVCWISV